MTPTGLIASPSEAQRRFAERTAAVEAHVRTAHDQYLQPLFSGRLAVLAVGGFGRGDLFPHSDIDVLLLVSEVPETPAEREALSFFQRHLWDQKLRLSQGLRTVIECVMLDENDIERTISLLDRRFLCGHEPLFRDLEQRMPRFLQAKRGIMERHLCRLSRERHAKFAHTIFHLEPDIKEAPGGLRDLHVLHWLNESPAGLEPARDYLYQLRFALHDQSKRDNNLLNYDLQEIVFPDPCAGLREYYRHARQIHRAALRALERHQGQTSGLLSQFRDWRSRLSNENFTVSRDRIYFRVSHASPDVKLAIFPFVARHGIRLAPDTEERLAEGRAQIAGVATDWAWWKDLLSQPHAGVALRAMHETGALSAQLPEWEHVESLVTRDFYHRYTVDEHTLVAVETLEKLKDSADKSAGRFADLFAEAEGIALLRFALLCHDIGKGTGKEHSEESTRLAAQILDRLGAPEIDRRTVLFLIEHHLDLSSLMTSRDLSDADVLADAAHRMETLEQLRLLALLTYADISAVNPETMTPWRADQLWRAFRLIRQELTRELEAERIQPEDAVDPWLSGFPTRYLHRHTTRQMEQHRIMGQAARALGVALELRKTEAAWEVVFVAPDRPGLFAAVCGALASTGMSILKVEAFANQEGQVLDTFTFADPTRTLELNPSEVDTVRKRVLAAIKSSADVEKWLKARPRPKPRLEIKPIVAVDSQATKGASLVEVVAADRPGLLYDLASVIAKHGCSIDVVLIDTETHKALDTFYVTKGGLRLDDDEATALKDALLEVCRA